MNNSTRPDTPLLLNHHLWILAASIVILGMARVLSVQDRREVHLPGAHGPTIPQTCVMKRVLGIDCPVCGLTRSLILIAHGDFAAAWHLHRLGFLIFGVFLFQIPYRIFVLTTGRRVLLFGSQRFITRLAYLLIALFLINWVANLLTGTMTP